MIREGDADADAECAAAGLAQHLRRTPAGERKRPTTECTTSAARSNHSCTRYCSVYIDQALSCLPVMPTGERTRPTIECTTSMMAAVWETLSGKSTACVCCVCTCVQDC